MIDKKKSMNFVNMGMFLIFTIGLLTLCQNLYKKNHELKNRQIVNEAVILNMVREYEFRNSMEKIRLGIELNTCNGEDTLKLDSLRTHIIFVNQIIKTRDSLYIVDRLDKLDNYNGF